MKMSVYIRHLMLLLVLMTASHVPLSAGLTDNEAYDRWHADKYSMFIHFGLYSYYGGVWDGKPVTRGYSEQIQSHAGIYGDWYAAAAEVFDPAGFNADQIVSLAKDSGMRSVVFTSKHHDGFCMFGTQTTGYNSVDMMTSGRDFVAELSDACRRHGLKFGLYFSLIDWSYPHAYPISSHNADFITDQHHQLNLSQVTELLTQYGPVSELWFDMGSLKPQQSRELYELVKRLQPQCMVSGRLGNDMYDFAVMPDNTYPDGSLQAPWQTAASMFNETWSWRSWQERGEVQDKVAEKLRSLVNVVSHGGNFLLNVGPDSSGVVIPFEKQVLEGIGRWLRKNAEAIYDTEASPFREDFSWGSVTVRGKHLNLLLGGTEPENGLIELDMPGYRVIKVLTEDVKYRQKNGMVTVEVPDGAYSDKTDIKVITLEMNRKIEQIKSEQAGESESFMTCRNAVKDYSYSCFDYYSNYRSTVAYSWTFTPSRVPPVMLYYTADQQNRKVCVDVNGRRTDVDLASGISAQVPMAVLEAGPAKYARYRGGSFNGPSEWKVYGESVLAGLKPVAGDVLEQKVSRFSNHLLIREIKVEKPGFAVFDIQTGNGMELVLDGVSVVKHLNPYGTSQTNEKVVLYLEEGTHQVLLRAYNRFEEHLQMSLQLSDADFKCVEIPVNDSKICTVRISAADLPSVHTDSGLHNLFIFNAAVR